MSKTRNAKSTTTSARHMAESRAIRDRVSEYYRRVAADRQKLENDSRKWEIESSPWLMLGQSRSVTELANRIGPALATLRPDRERLIRDMDPVPCVVNIGGADDIIALEYARNILVLDMLIDAMGGIQNRDVKNRLKELEVEHGLACLIDSIESIAQLVLVWIRDGLTAPPKPRAETATAAVTTNDPRINQT